MKMELNKRRQMSISLDDIIGKTIESAYIEDMSNKYPDRIVFHFTDRTKATIETSEWVSDMWLGDKTEETN